MKIRTCVCMCLALLLLAGAVSAGQPDIKSAGPMCFGPNGTLFVGDPTGAAIFAFDTGDTKAASGHVKADGIDAKIATLLGTTPKEMLINDMAVNPVSGNVYFSVSRGRGPDAVPVICRLDRGGKLSEFSLKDVKFTKAALPNAPENREGQRNPRTQTITDMAFIDGRLFIAGLSNEEFASKLRSIPYPFQEVEKGTSVEIYHGAHGAFETRAPIMTFAAYKLGGEEHLLAAYTCTPLVRFPVSQLKPSEKPVKGTTIAELGNRNRPLDMIIYSKGGKDFILMANNARGVMKIPLENAGTQEGITNKINDKAGLAYETIAELKGVEQLDKLDGNHAVILVRAGESLNLQTIHMP